VIVLARAVPAAPSNALPAIAYSGVPRSQHLMLFAIFEISRKSGLIMPECEKGHNTSWIHRYWGSPHRSGRERELNVVPRTGAGGML
jgi:hypothetical protein